MLATFKSLPSGIIVRRIHLSSIIEPIVGVPNSWLSPILFPNRSIIFAMIYSGRWCLLEYSRPVTLRMEFAEYHHAVLPDSLSDFHNINPEVAFQPSTFRGQSRKR